MTLHFDRLQLNPQLGNLSRSIAFSLFVLIVCPSASFASQPTLTVIELYDGPNGAAYLQLSDVLINGKATLRDCTPFQATGVDKSSYGKMQKITLSPGAVLSLMLNIEQSKFQAAVRPRVVRVAIQD